MDFQLSMLCCAVHVTPGIRLMSRSLAALPLIWLPLAFGVDISNMGAGRQKLGAMSGMAFHHIGLTG